MHSDGLVPGLTVRLHVTIWLVATVRELTVGGR